MKKQILVGAMLVVSSCAFAQQETGIQEVTIASKVPQQIFKTGKNVQLLSAKDLEKFKGQNVNDVLNQLTGFQITGNNNNGTEPKSMKIRGGKSANVLILVDGVPLKDVTGNDYTVSDLRLIALENIESIEVLNGASSVLYGSNATVSVINIKTKKSAQKNIEGQLSARAGSFDTYGQAVLLKGKLSDFNYQVSGFNEKSEGLSSADGIDFKKDSYEKQNFAANVGYNKDNFSLNVNGGYSHNLYDYDGGAFTDADNRGDDFQKFAGLSSKYNYKNGEVHFNSRITSTNRVGQSFDGNYFQDQFTYAGTNFFSELFNQYQFSKNISLIAGVQYETQKLGATSLPFGGTALEDVLLKNDTKNNNFDVFAQANFNLEGFNLDLGIRNTNQSKFGNHFVYSINPYYLKEFADQYLKIGYSFSTAFIAPTLYQSFGSLPYTLANFDLKPETNSSNEIDLAFGEKDQSFVINVSLFQRQEKEAFAYQTVDFVTFAGQFLNVENNKVKGFDVGFNYRINPIFNVGGNFSYVEKEKEATMLRQPKQRINSFVEITAFKGNRINLTQQFVSKRADAYFDSNTFAIVPVDLKSYNLFNLNVNQTIVKNLSIFANVCNLFNTSYVDVVGFTTKPRNYTVGFDYKF
ncbi:TonB-dependent receptor plug domain-containing protein [Halpernia frigidisoli]|uniref:Vitamin B12 transporter n=1 Tax=Halpernia frigidisoli TaxID=1125876 RepID=A0A1I3FLP7_9FLAO|nr:TonB-dependent receptor [Halpernia frigidisoli]SFI12104.1 vitamin B12 transporter [Halpernia frigidisoli]